MPRKIDAKALDAAAELKAKRFAEAYIRAGLGCRAYREINPGCAEATAKTQGQYWLGKDRVRRLLDEAMQEAQQRLDVTQERVLRELARIAFVDPRRMFSEDGNLIPVPALGADEAAALASFDVDMVGGVVTKKVRLHSKVQVLGMLAEHLGLVKKPTAKDGDGEESERGSIPVQADETMEQFLSRIAKRAPSAS